MSDLQNLLAEKKRIEKEHKKVQQQLQRAKARAQKELRSRILKMCSEAGTSVEELFGAKPKTAAKSKTRTKRTTKSNTPDKYFLDGKGVDGRKARTIKDFDKIRVNGKIDDKKAIAAKMINPAWLKTKSPIVAKFIKDTGVDVAKYTV